MWLWTLLACDEYGLKSENLDTGIGVEIETELNCDQNLCIDSITPNWGPATGGTEVHIYGSGFGNDVGVMFSRFEITDLTRLGPNELVLTSPQGPNGSIDITVWSQDAEVIISNGFTYSDTAPPEDTGNNDTGNNDTGNNDTGNNGGNNNGGDNSGSGLTGGLVEYSMVVDGFLLASQTGYAITANALLHQPTAGSWLSWMAPVGDCIDFTGSSTLSNQPLSLGSWAYLTAPNSSIPLQFNGNAFAASNLGTADYIKGNSYDLSIPDHNIEIPDAVVTAMGMGQTFGPTHFFAGGDYSYNYYMSNSTMFTWDVDSDAASTMLFIVQVVEGSAPTNTLLHFQCHVADTGFYQFPPDIFSSLWAGDLMIIQMLRLRTTTSLHPQNGSTIEGFSTTGGIGVAVFAQ